MSGISKLRVGNMMGEDSRMDGQADIRAFRTERSLD